MPGCSGHAATTAASDNNSAGGAEALRRRGAGTRYSSTPGACGTTASTFRTPRSARTAASDAEPDLAETGASQETIEAAEAACQPILDAVNAAGEQPDPQETAETLDQMVAVTECMREKGYDMADPSVGDDGGIRAGGGLSRDASQEQIEQMEVDLEACEDQAGIEPLRQRGGRRMSSEAASTDARPGEGPGETTSDRTNLGSGGCHGPASVPTPGSSPAGW